jgi:hypothetical protein
MLDMIFIYYYFKLYSGQLYGKKDHVEERHRHRYEVNPQYIQQLESAGFKFVGKFYFFTLQLTTVHYRLYSLL